MAFLDRPGKPAPGRFANPGVVNRKPMVETNNTIANTLRKGSVGGRADTKPDLGLQLTTKTVAPVLSYQPFTRREATNQTSPQRRLIEGLTAYIGGCGPGGSPRPRGQLAEDVVEGDGLTVSTAC